MRTRNSAKRNFLISLQALIRGYLARLKFKKIIENKLHLEKQKNYAKLIDRVKSIQSHWRGHEIRKVYRVLKLDSQTKAMQLGYFNQQVILIKLYLIYYFIYQYR